jgi:hypothetical protein
VQLAAGVDAKDASSSLTQRAVEALYRLPEDTVRIDGVREDPTQIRVTFILEWVRLRRQAPDQDQDPDGN